MENRSILVVSSNFLREKKILTMILGIISLIISVFIFNDLYTKCTLNVYLIFTLNVSGEIANTKVFVYKMYTQCLLEIYLINLYRFVIK